MPHPPMSHPSPAGEKNQGRGQRSLNSEAQHGFRLPLNLLELALEELEHQWTEEVSPQARESLLAISSRLHSLTVGKGKALLEEGDRPVRRESRVRTLETSGGLADRAKFKDKQRNATRSTLLSQKSELPEQKLTAIANFPSESMQRNISVMSSNRLNRKAKRQELTRLFNQLDLDGNGYVGIEEMTATLGLSRAEVESFMREADISGDSLIHRREFLDALEKPGAAVMLSHLTSIQLLGSDIKMNTYRCMISQVSIPRVCWDVTCCVALLYIAVLEPVFLAFSDVGKGLSFEVISVVMDVFFLCDVVLNFRTGYYTADGFEVMEPWLVAKHYLRTWFALDLVSSVPVDLVPANVTDPQSLRLLKSWKIARVMKLMRIFDAMKRACGDDVVMDFIDWLHKVKIHRYLPLITAFLVTTLVCHWLACFMVVSGDGFLDGFENDTAARYAGAVYWAVTTISTVGYGDITPASTTERLYTIFAMLVGGAFYGYIIAKVVSVVTRSELSDQAYQEKISEVHAWLEFHQLPKDLQRRTRRYMETYFKQRANLDDATMLSLLSPELRTEISEHTVAMEVRDLPVFADLPLGFMSRLPKILRHFGVDACERIVQRGEVGSAVYIIAGGEVMLDFGDLDEDNSSANRVRLHAGDSFGEELLLHPGRLRKRTAAVQTYTYTALSLIHI